jgi:Holliday junction resolvase RusA-like endonuclease
MEIGLALDSFRYDNEVCWFEIVVKTTEFPSVNSLYGINRRSKIIYTLPHVVKFQGELKDQIILTDPKLHCPWVADSQVYFFHSTFILNHKFWGRDLDNLLKSPIDVIFQCIGVNDARIVEHHSFKNFKPGDYEYLILKVGLSQYPYNQFNN